MREKKGRKFFTIFPGRVWGTGDVTKTRNGEYIGNRQGMGKRECWNGKLKVENSGQWYIQIIWSLRNIDSLMTSSKSHVILDLKNRPYSLITRRSNMRYFIYHLSQLGALKN